jgi:hypothetical protein
MDDKDIERKVNHAMLKWWFLFACGAVGAYLIHQVL